MIDKNKAELIEEFKNKGLTYREISDKTGYSKSYISKYLNGKIKIKEDLNEINFINEGLSVSKSFPNRFQNVSNPLNEDILSQIKDELTNFKLEIKQYIKENVPNIEELNEIKRENKSLFGKLEFIKSILKRINPNIYSEIIKEINNKRSLNG